LSAPARCLLLSSSRLGASFPSSREPPAFCLLCYEAVLVLVLAPTPTRVPTPTPIPAPAPIPEPGPGPGPGPGPETGPVPRRDHDIRSETRRGSRRRRETAKRARDGAE